MCSQMFSEFENVTFLYGYTKWHLELLTLNFSLKLNKSFSKPTSEKEWMNL